MKRRFVGIRAELVMGFVAIMLVCGAVTNFVILFSSRASFDTLVQRSDIETAKSVAQSIAPFYAGRGSWAGIGTEIAKLGSTFLKQNESAAERGASGKGEPNRGKDHGQIPLVITDASGLRVFPPENTPSILQPHETENPLRFKTRDGIGVVVDGKTVGYVFFKSMLRLEYSPQEEAFISSMAISTSLSVLTGFVIAVILGSFFSSRFVRPVVDLELAVKKIANGESGVRAKRARNDEIGQLAENFNAMAEKIEMTERARRNLLADMAHELRTPVSIIQANLEMIIDGVYRCDPERLKSLYEETRILTALIADLREISDFESGMISLDLQPVRVMALLRETCEKYRPLFDGRSIGISLVQEGDEGLLAFFDENRLRQVLRNVLMNALKYTQPHTGVTVACRRVVSGPKPMIRIEVSDEGPGVPDADIEKIFERFYRVDASRNRDSGGRGLGLAICRQFVESGGGSIDALNRIPHGLEIRIDLPEARS